MLRRLISQDAPDAELQQPPRRAKERAHAEPAEHLSF